MVDEADLKRFSALGVIPNMQPLWAQMDALMTVLTIPRLGVERADRQYQMRSLHDTGAALAFGSDWPVSSGAPLDGIAVAVSRRTAEGEPEGGWTPHEIVPIDLALSSYTGAVAYQALPRAIGDASFPEPVPIGLAQRRPAQHPRAATPRTARPRHVPAWRRRLHQHPLEKARP